MTFLTEENPRHECYRLIGIVVWVSFVAACIATALFFATFDPLEIIELTTFPLGWNRTECYSAGFLMFWALTAGTGFMVTWLVVSPVPSTKRIQQMKQGGDES